MHTNTSLLCYFQYIYEGKCICSIFDDFWAGSIRTAAFMAVIYIYLGQILYIASPLREEGVQRAISSPPYHQGLRNPRSNRILAAILPKCSKIAWSLYIHTYPPSHTLGSPFYSTKKLHIFSRNPTLFHKNVATRNNIQLQMPVTCDCFGKTTPESTRKMSRPVL